MKGDLIKASVCCLVIVLERRVIIKLKFSIRPPRMIVRFRCEVENNALCACTQHYILNAPSIVHFEVMRQPYEHRSLWLKALVWRGAILCLFYAGGERTRKTFQALV